MASDISSWGYLVSRMTIHDSSVSRRPVGLYLAIDISTSLTEQHAVVHRDS